MWSQSKVLAKTSGFNVEEMQRLLEHDNHERRAAFKQFVAQEPVFIPRFNVSLRYERELALERLKKVCAGGHVSVRDFIDNPLMVFAAHEIAGQIDGSMATKMTVQFNLFGGTVLKLGTQERHWHLLDGIDALTDVGCFALTELGYGNNAVEMETTAHYDAATEQFVIHTPTPLAQKYWITNSAVHAKWAVVFAQLFVAGTHHGIHAFLVRIREDDMSVSPGVTIQDMGHKVLLLPFFHSFNMIACRWSAMGLIMASCGSTRFAFHVRIYLIAFLMSLPPVSFSPKSAVVVRVS